MLNTNINVRMTTEEKMLIQAQAKKRAMELAPYARKVLLGKHIPNMCACGLHWGHVGKHATK